MASRASTAPGLVTGSSGWLTATVRREPGLARRFFDRFEPVHAVTYFAPEARAALDGLGYRGFWMGYFAARSAPLGIVPPEVVTATFYNFAPERVAKALPAAWQIAGPEAALRARRDSAVAALRRYGLSVDEKFRVAAELAGRAARQAPLDGRPLFAANLALPWPDDPLAALWHAATLLREQRGDGHVAVLTAAGVSGRESNVLHAAAGRIPRDYIARTRDYDEAAWRHHEQRLAERGLLNDDGSLTAAGRELKDDIESRTDRLALSALDALNDDEVESLFQALTPITRAVVAGGDVPAVTPMDLRRDELNDGSAHSIST
jgi:Helix-turn-helix family